MSGRLLMAREIFNDRPEGPDRTRIGTVAVWAGESKARVQLDAKFGFRQMGSFELVELSCALMDAANLLAANKGMHP